MFTTNRGKFFFSIGVKEKHFLQLLFILVRIVMGMEIEFIFSFLKISPSKVLNNIWGLEDIVT